MIGCLLGRYRVEEKIGEGAAAPRVPAWKSALLVLAALAVLIGGTIGVVLLFTGRGGLPAARTTQSGRPSLAVMNFENRTGDERYDRYGVGATELLTVDLARPAGNLDLVSSQRLFDVLQGMNRKLSALDRTVATEVARRCNARYMLRGELLLLSDSVIAKTEIIEVESGRLVSAQRVVGLNDQNLLDKIDELSRLVREDLKGLR